MTLKISATGLRLRILLAAEKSVAHDLRLYYGIKNKYGIPKRSAYRARRWHRLTDRLRAQEPRRSQDVQDIMAWIGIAAGLSPWPRANY
jgi:hypothetical protein